MFKDKVYEDLDEISKLVEPFQSGINEELSLFPDKIEVTNDNILESNGGYGFSRINAEDIVSKKAEELGLLQLQRESYNLAREFFEFEVEDLEEDETVTVDFENNTVSHKIFLVKTKIGYDDAELEKQARANMLNKIRRNLNSNKAVNKSRLNEVADLYGAKDVCKDRSYKGKVRKFCKHLEYLMDERLLDIKDIELSGRFAEWIVFYVREGNLPALNNITRIKIMMHENRPIYSIEERSIK